MVSNQNIIAIKTAIVLNEMLIESQQKGSKHARIADRKIEDHNSLGKISVETGITKSTLSHVFNGKSGTKLITLLPILIAFNKSLVDFSKRFEKITDSDIQRFKELHRPSLPRNKNNKRKVNK